MLLKNMMEDKQLNLSRPLLSVRRHTSTLATEKDNKKNNSFLPTIPRPPPYKSELKSGPVSNPGTVPFIWERSPGRPKDDRPLQTHSERPPIAPKLPPGRILIANQQDYDNASENSTVNKSQVVNPHGSRSVSELDEDSRRFECSEDTVEEAQEEKADSGDEDEEYEDALDTLSRTESFFLNCSVSGISGLDDSDVKPSGTFSTDPQARDFMIGRFLPAAKAMVSETSVTPQYAPNKQPLVQDHPRQPKKVVNGDKRPQLRYGPSFAKHYSEFHDNGEEESDDDYEETADFPTKACGLLPRFCLKSSFCLLNPLPGMSVRTRTPMSPARRVQARSSSSASTCSKTENELSSFDMSEQRSIDGSQIIELDEEKNDLNIKSNQIPLKPQKHEGPYRHGGLSSHYNESSLTIERRALPSIAVEANDAVVDGFSSPEETYRSFKDLLADQSTSEEVDSGSPAVEKTLYIDTVRKGESSEKKLPSNIKGLSNLGGKNDEGFMKVEKNLTEDSLLIEKLSIVDGGDTLQPNFQNPLDFSFLSSADEHSQKIEKDAPKAFGTDQNLYKDAIDSKFLEEPVKQATQCLRKQTSKEEKVKIFRGIYSEFPIPPPLPKSPSDSWLCRTLPSMSSNNSSMHSHFGVGINPRNQALKTQSGDPTWETIVKTTKAHHQHLRYSEELLAPIPES